MNMEDEVICGHLVTAEDKKRNKVFLDMLVEFDALCKRNGLRYFMFYGGLLGAVRHKGFIPWDDDIDVVLPREDYNKLYFASNEELGVKYPYSVQNAVNDENCLQPLIRFRRSDMTSIKNNEYQAIISGDEKETKRLDYDMGMEICVFPLNDFAEGSLRCKIKHKLSWRLCSIVFCYQYYDRKDLYRKFCLAFIKLFGKKRVMGWAQKAMTPPKNVKCDKYRNLIFPRKYLKEWFASAVEVPFEDITVPIPVGYDEILTAIYGNYMEFPPLEGRGVHDRFVSTDICYKEAIEKFRNGELEFPKKFVKKKPEKKKKKA